ncbi:MAG: pentapeptide repeat-containing protein [Spirochaetaceae bacterium]|jgi:hypothetical protein|nr:pentapeptide repeat-containing protein [Spirochaetaceae bacterium]
MGLKGYKGFDKNLKCRGFQYEIGRIYEMPEPPSVCSRGFHFCKKIVNVHGYYNLENSRICEVEALGEIAGDGNKSVTNRIQIIRELSREEIRSIANTGTDNTGYINSGNRNSGNRNSGDWNSGNRNSGEFNSCDNSAGIFMSRRISYEAFNKSLAKDEYEELTRSEGYWICLNFELVRFRVRTKTGKFGDFRYMGYKASWKVFWSSLTFGQRQAVRQMPFMDKDVFFEITGVKI